MKQFVLLFRQTRTLSEPEQTRRATEVRAWAQQRIKDGRKLDPRILGTENRLVAAEEKQRADGGTLVAMTFLEAADFGSAVGIAESHPGLRYGVTIEVRPWEPPVPAVAPLAAQLTRP